MIQENARVIEHTRLAPKYFILTLSSDHISKNAKPGQFVNVKVSSGTIPLLRRPISIHMADPEKGTFSLLYEIIGKGTELLSQQAVGAELSVLGPLGSGFALDADICVLVSGGMGIAPIGFLARTALKMKKEVHVLMGARTKELVLCEEGLKSLGAKVTVATEDGSYGEKGLVTDMLKTANYDPRSTTIYACGPNAMLAAVSKIAQKNNFNCQVSMEAYIACGIGACKGCAIETSEGYKMVCKDGPVFNAKEIKW